MNEKQILVPIFEQIVYCWTGDIKEMAGKAEKDLHIRMGTSSPACMFESGGAYYLCIDDYFRKDIATVVHECNHIIIKMLTRLGIHDEETHCYLLGYLVEEVWKNI